MQAVLTIVGYNPLQPNEYPLVFLVLLFQKQKKSHQ